MCLLMAKIKKLNFTDLKLSGGANYEKHSRKGHKSALEFIDLLKHFESYEMKAYKCPGGVWTIGWGFTRVKGIKVKEGDILTLEEADIELKKQLKIYENLVKKVIMIKKINQYDALVSLCYNIGGSNFRRSSIVKLVNSRNFIEACRIFNLWSKPAQKRSKGLLRIKGKGLEFRVNLWKLKTKLFEFKIFRKANSTRELFWRYKE